MALFVSIVLALLCAWALLQPHVAAQVESAGGNSELEPLLDQKNRCLQLLKDLELDFATSKVTEVDYTRMRGSLSAELAALLARIDDTKGR